jgi:hypothetical protein
MLKQRTALEFSEEKKRFRAVMEQNAIQFEVRDVPMALDCLLDLLGGRGLDVLETVKDMLIARTYSRIPVQSKAALFLGASPRKLNYHIVQRGALDAQKLITQYEKEKEEEE